MEKKELTTSEMQEYKDAKPSWQKDGLGLRGDATVIHNTKANLNWQSKVVTRRPELNSRG